MNPHCISVQTKPSIHNVKEQLLMEEIERFLHVKLEALKIVSCYHIDTPLPRQQLEKLAQIALSDPVLEDFLIDTPPTSPEYEWTIHVCFKPGVTDTLGSTAQIAIEDCLGQQSLPPNSVSSSRSYLLKGALSAEQARDIAHGWLANQLIETIVIEPTVATENIPDSLYETLSLELADEDLLSLSQERTLALSLKEMIHIRDNYRRDELVRERKAHNLPPSPTDVELEALAQTWSEHCKHKIFNANIRFSTAKSTKTIHSLFKTYICGATEAIAERVNWLVSVFHDNAGIIKFTDVYNLAFKVETHNSPSALDPYGGALTGILGVNRDCMGTGIGSRLVANTDVFCFADPNYADPLPPRLLHPRRILRGVRLGVEHGGNKSGIPTVNGCLVFDKRYLGKPLVYCGTVGILPKQIQGQPTEKKEIYPGDLIVVAGGQTGRDGIHGATFSSEALNETSPCSAVQIGDPFTQKKLHDFLLEARDRLLYRTLTDNGAGGFSSSVGELAELSGGCQLSLDKVPLKTQDLRPWEILLSESQERMTLAVPPNNWEALATLAKEHEVDIAAIGHFNDSGYFHVCYGEHVVAHLEMSFLHGGVPLLELEAEWAESPMVKAIEPSSHSLESDLLALLARPNICSKESLVRQYDHEVQGATLVKPLCGLHADGPSDAAVIQPIEVTAEGGTEGFVLGTGICPRYSERDPYVMAQLAMDEALRNVVSAGGDPAHTALLDNFCWPDPVYHPQTNPDGKRKLGQLVLAAQALYDTAIAWDTPFISGKDSMKNDYCHGDIKISIPPTLLISALAKIPDCRRAITMDVKYPGDLLYVLGHTRDALGASEYAALQDCMEKGTLPTLAPESAKQLFHRLHAAIRGGLVRSCHDCSDGGLLVALAESAFAGGLGLDVHVNAVPQAKNLTLQSLCFSESPSRFVVSIRPEDQQAFESCLADSVFGLVGRVRNDQSLILRDTHGKSLFSLSTGSMKAAWQGGKLC